MSYLVLQGLSKRYGDNTVVDDLSLSVERGEFISLLGPSGCGKTTTLQMIAGFVEPSGGSITLDGRNLQGVPSNRRGLGVVFQNYALFPHMTAAENVAFGLEMRKVERAERAKRVAEALELVGLAHLAERYPAQMSGGQQQRVALARALVIRPSILLLDEPLSNLDAKLREEMQIELRNIQRSVGTTAILVTHDQGEALALSDRVAVLNRGRIEQIAAPFAAYEGPATSFVSGFLGKANVFSLRANNRNGADGVAVGEAHFAVDRSRFTSGRVMVRPEKVLFREPGEGALPGRLKARVFQGSYWLCEVETSVGPVHLIRQNDGLDIPAVGELVHVGWRIEDMRPIGHS